MRLFKRRKRRLPTGCRLVRRGSGNARRIYARGILPFGEQLREWQPTVQPLLPRLLAIRDYPHLTDKKEYGFSQVAMEIVRNRAYDGNPPKFIPGIENSSYN